GVFRTLFLAAPAQATLVACAVVGARGLLPGRAGRLAVAACLGYVAAVTAAQANREQEATGPDRFARLVHTFNQAPAAAPRFTPGPLGLLILDGDIPDARRVLACNGYALGELSRTVLGTPFFLVNARDPGGFEATFTRAGVKARTVLHAYEKRYDEVV